MEIVRQRRRRRRRVIRRWLWLLVGALLVGVVLPRWTESFVRGWFVSTITPRPGPLEVVTVRPGLALWHETVVAAPASGVLSKLVADGERVQAGQAVAVLGERSPDWRPESRRTGSSHTVYAPTAGLVRFDWMGPPRPAPEQALSWEDRVLQGIGSLRHKQADGDRIREGDLLFRIVDNHRAFLFVPWEDGPPVERGQRVWIRPAPPAAGRRAGDLRASGVPPRGSADERTVEFVGEVAARVLATRPLPSGTPGDAVLFELDRWPSGWESLSWVDVEIVVARFRGLIIPERLLVERGGRWGVYVRGRNAPIFQAVTVTGRWEGLVAVTGIAPGIDLLAEPPEEGWR